MLEFVLVAIVLAVFVYYLVLFVIGDADNATFLAVDDKEYYRDKVVWVTGASSGIGMQYCRHISALRVGAKLIVRCAPPAVGAPALYDARAAARAPSRRCARLRASCRRATARASRSSCATWPSSSCCRASLKRRRRRSAASTFSSTTAACRFARSATSRPWRVRTRAAPPRRAAASRAV